MSSMMYANQNMMFANMYGSGLGATQSGPVYNVTGDYYAGNYSNANTSNTTSPQNYQLPLPSAMSADYRSFGNIVQAPRASTETSVEAPKVEITEDRLPATQLNDTSETVGS
jgi:hypothetical protein